MGIVRNRKKVIQQSSQMFLKHVMTLPPIQIFEPQKRWKITR